MGKISKALEKAEAERQKRFTELSDGQAQMADGFVNGGETSIGVLELPSQTESSVDGLPFPLVGETEIDERVVALFDPRSPAAEQYRILRTNLLSLTPGKPVKMVLVSSSLHSEGKTVSSVNLAITMANDVTRRRVLLIDADLRAGTVHQLLAMNPKVGLSDVLAKGIPWQEALVPTALPNLTIMSSGQDHPPHPAELLSSPRMREILTQVRSSFDFCIVDAPPIVPLTDPSVLGGLTDGALLVVRAGKTQRTIVQQAASLLAQANVRLLGCILTHMESYIPEYIYRYSH